VTGPVKEGWEEKGAALRCRCASAGQEAQCAVRVLPRLPVCCCLLCSGAEGVRAVQSARQTGHKECVLRGGAGRRAGPAHGRDAADGGGAKHTAEWHSPARAVIVSVLLRRCEPSAPVSLRGFRAFRGWSRAAKPPSRGQGTPAGALKVAGSQAPHETRCGAGGRRREWVPAVCRNARDGAERARSKRKRQSSAARGREWRAENGVHVTS
jgi:hypothetical protein